MQLVQQALRAVTAFAPRPTWDSARGELIEYKGLQKTFRELRCLSSEPEVKVKITFDAKRCRLPAGYQLRVSGVAPVPQLNSCQQANVDTAGKDRQAHARGAPRAACPPHEAPRSVLVWYQTKTSFPAKKCVQGSVK